MKAGFVLSLSPRLSEICQQQRDLQICVRANDSQRSAATATHSDACQQRQRQQQPQKGKCLLQASPHTTYATLPPRRRRTSITVLHHHQTSCRSSLYDEYLDEYLGTTTGKSSVAAVLCDESIHQFINRSNIFVHTYADVFFQELDDS